MYYQKKGWIGVSAERGWRTKQGEHRVRTKLSSAYKAPIEAYRQGGKSFKRTIFLGFHILTTLFNSTFFVSGTSHLQVCSV